MEILTFGFFVFFKNIWTKIDILFCVTNGIRTANKALTKTKQAFLLNILEARVNEMTTRTFFVKKWKKNIGCIFSEMTFFYKFWKISKQNSLLNDTDNAECYLLRRALDPLFWKFKVMISRLTSFYLSGVWHWLLKTRFSLV